ncbi:hypothetical protein M123_4658, partial [Bacteroides fragilis str. 3976T8]
MGKDFIVFFKTVKIHFSKNNSFKDTSLSRNLCNPVTYEVTDIFSISNQAIS